MKDGGMGLFKNVAEVARSVTKILWICTQRMILLIDSEINVSGNSRFSHFRRDQDRRRGLWSPSHRGTVMLTG